MDKRTLHHKLVVLRHIKTWQLLIVLVLLTAASVYLLRQNNLGMVDRRNAVKQADEQGADVQKLLTELQRFVGTHMNTDLGQGIFLEHSYQRAYDQAVQTATSAPSVNSQAYQSIEAGCRQQYSRGGSFAAYLACIENGLKALAPGADPLANLKAPPAELFKYNFVSPAWSADLAGFTVLASLLVALTVVLRWLLYGALRLVLRLRHN